MNSRELEHALGRHFDRFAANLKEQIAGQQEDRETTAAFVAGMALAIGEMRTLRRTRYARNRRRQWWKAGR